MAGVLAALDEKTLQHDAGDAVLTGRELLAKRGGDGWLTAVILVVSLGLLFRFKVNNPALVAVCAMIGVVAFPLLKPTFVFVQ